MLLLANIRTKAGVVTSNRYQFKNNKTPPLYLRNGVPYMHHACSPFPNSLRKNTNNLSNLTPIKLFVKDFRVLRMIAKFNKTISFQLYLQMYCI